MGAEWQSYEHGASIGSTGSEGGMIILDDWHSADARVTLERGGETAPFAITCGVGGWFVHTMFFATEDDAQNAFKSIKVELDHIIKLIPSATDATREQMTAVTDVIRDFVARH